MAQHVMLHMQTMGVSPGSAIISLGAVVFDPRFQTDGATFYREFDWQAQLIDLNLNVEPGSKKFWDEQSGEALQVLEGLDDLEEELKYFADWLPRDCRLWALDKAWAFSILEHCYREIEVDVPWPFWATYDCRTFLAMYEETRGGLQGGAMPKRDNTSRNALDDAIWQAKLITKYYSKLRNK